MLRVLIIDSDAVTRNRIASLLEQRGFESDQAATRLESKHLLAIHDYALIMIDLGIADHHGLEFLEELRSEYPKKMSHTVLLTHPEASAFANRSDDWCAVLVKPFSAAEFYRTVDFCMDDHESPGLRYH